jgi:hypothetical protein
MSPPYSGSNKRKARRRKLESCTQCYMPEEHHNDLYENLQCYKVVVLKLETSETARRI